MVYDVENRYEKPSKVIVPTRGRQHREDILAALNEQDAIWDRYRFDESQIIFNPLSTDSEIELTSTLDELGINYRTFGGSGLTNFMTKRQLELG